MKLIPLYIALLLSCMSQGQTVINDAGMKECLVNDYPALVNGGDSTLNNTAASAYIGDIVCDGSPINDISILQHFPQVWGLNVKNVQTPDLSFIATLTNLTKIEIGNSQIGSFPGLVPLNRLNYLWLNNCGLTDFPELNDSIETVYFGNNLITEAHLTKSYPVMGQLMLSGNNLTSISGLENTSILWRLYVGGNDLKVLPDLSTLDSLQELYAWGNELTAINGLQNKVNLSEVVISDNLFTDVPDFGANPPDTLAIAYNYFTFEDILPLQSLSAFPAPGDNYQIQRIQGNSQTVYLTENESWNWTIPFDDTVSTNYYLWFQDSVQIDSTLNGDFMINSFSITDTGTYYCEVRNTILDTVVIQVATKKIQSVSTKTNTKPIAFSPNGDGDYDELYIEFEGQTKIYDTQGNCIKDLVTPGIWDGTTNEGAEAEFGYYFIFTDGQPKISVTLVR